VTPAATPDATAEAPNRVRLRVPEPEPEPIKRGQVTDPEEIRTRQAEEEHQAELEADAANTPPRKARQVSAEDEGKPQATRSERPLANEEFEAYKARLIAKGVPADQIHPGDFTAFHPDGKGGGHVTVGPDVNPLPEAERPTNLANPANAALDAESSLSHESIGHREAEMAGQAHEHDPQMEEAQASARAAVLDPDLTPQQRDTLMQDSAARLRGRDNGDNIYMYMDRYESPRQRRAPRDDTPAAGAPRTPDQFRPQDQQPSVIINHEALGMEPPASGGRSVQPEPASRAPATSSTPEEAPHTPPLAPPAPMTPATPAPGGTTEPAAPGVAPPAASTSAGPQSPSWGTRLGQVGQLFRPHVFGIGDAEPPKPAEVEAQQRKQYTADNQPAKGVERVNPAYPEPPGTPQQLEAMQQEISHLLATRAQAEQEAAHQDGRAQQCEANQGPIQQTLDDTTQGISAVQAHAQSVAAHDAANQAQQQRQQESQGLVAGYPSKATGLAVLSVPLAAWQGFTSMASYLPGDAGTKMTHMNEDANKMQSAFGDMGAQMLGVDGQQPARQAELQGDKGRLGATATQAQSSGEDLRTAQAGAQGLQQGNAEAQSEAEQLRDNATQQGQQMDAQASAKKEQAKTLSEQMQAWAAAHKAARQAAIDATAKRLQAEGKVNVKVEQHA
jgi:hypothetical protein